MPESLLPELVAIEKIIEQGAAHLDVKVLRQVTIPSGTSFPVYAIALGNPARDVLDASALARRCHEAAQDEVRHGHGITHHGCDQCG